jgi:hypothetical protein
MIWNVITKFRTRPAIRHSNPDDIEDDALQINKVQFFAMTPDARRCHDSHAARMPITIIGLTADGKVKVFSGVIQSVETGHSIHAAFPLRVTISESYLKPTDTPRHLNQ